MNIAARLLGPRSIPGPLNAPSGVDPVTWPTTAKPSSPPLVTNVSALSAVLASRFTWPSSADPPDPAELRGYCRDRLAGYKVSRRFQLLAELPVGPTGKVLKHRLPPTD